MRNIYSMTGANYAGQERWVWCVPGDASPASMPVCVLAMSSVGPRYIPTRVIADERHRNHPGLYVELQPTVEDNCLMQAVLDWSLQNIEDDKRDNALSASFKAAINVAATMRFLDSSDEAHDAVGRSISDDNRYFGRSVLVHPLRSRVPVTGWIATEDEPFNVVILDDRGEFRKIHASADCLIEDGTN